VQLDAPRTFPDGTPQLGHGALTVPWISRSKRVKATGMVARRAQNKIITLTVIDRNTAINRADDRAIYPVCIHLSQQIVGQLLILVPNAHVTVAVNDNAHKLISSPLPAP
jgi:hypothetical protein